MPIAGKKSFCRKSLLKFIGFEDVRLFSLLKTDQDFSIKVEIVSVKLENHRSVSGQDKGKF